MPDMFKKSDKGYYFWEEFAKVDGVVHGFSTRMFGDMNPKNPRSNFNLNLFCKAVGINRNKIVKMDQVHGNNVEIVDYGTFLFRHSGKSRSAGRIQNLSRQDVAAARDSGHQAELGQARMTWVDDTDGLICSQKNVFLVASFADCVPVMFFDKKKKTVGIAHAGWRGAYKEIVRAMVSKMIDYGSSFQNILVGIGPSIRVCCYNIDNDRTMMFKNKFPKWQDRILKKRSNNVFLDLQTLINFQLLKSGVLSKNIRDSKICTKDNISDFYSFRGEHGQNSFGLSAAVIGRI